MNAVWRVELQPLNDLASLRAEWLRLSEQATTSFFTSWGWVESFLQGFPEESAAGVARVWKDGEVVGLSLLGKSRAVRGGVIGIRTLNVTESGHETYDELTIEHNAIVATQPHEEDVARELLRHLLTADQTWDELYLSGVRCGSPLEIAARELAPLCPLLTVKDRPYYWVNLEDLRTAGKPYMMALGSGTRSQTKRSLKFYASEFGAVRIQMPESREEALELFNEMVGLHTVYWQSKGHPGAFTAPAARSFHERLVSQRFDAGEIQLLRISAGSMLLNVLYNFVHNDVVYAYQSGFSYGQENKKKPGLVCHTLAIEYNLEAGRKLYDFLAGDHRYKLQLSTCDGTMRWLKFQRPRLKFRLEGALRTTRDAVVSGLKGRYAAWKARPLLAVAPAADTAEEHLAPAASVPDGHTADRTVLRQSPIDND